MARPAIEPVVPAIIAPRFEAGPCSIAPAAAVFVGVGMCATGELKEALVATATFAKRIVVVTGGEELVVVMVANEE